MNASVLAAVMTGPGETELHEMPMPKTRNDDGVLRVEACGVSQADPILFRRSDLSPAILGHEVVGTIERAGAIAAARWHAKEGDRVIIEEYVPCGACAWCAKGEYRLCAQAQTDAANSLRYGMTRTDVAPGLWGGFAQYLYLHAQSVVHVVPAGMRSSLAAFALPFANGMQWAALEGEVSPGNSVLIFGCELVGLAAARAAADAGADCVILCGLRREKERLAAGEMFGATHLPSADEEGLEAEIETVTRGRGADVIVDTTADTSGRVATTAIKCAAVGATLVLGGIGLAQLNLGEIRRKYLNIKPVRGHSAAAVTRALKIVERNASVLENLACRKFSLRETALAIRTGDTQASPGLLRAEVHPWM